MDSTPINSNDIEALQRQITELQTKLMAAQQANVSGSGAAAQGGGDALGERSVKADGENSGPINTGTQTIATQGGAAVQGAVQAGGHNVQDVSMQQILSVMSDAKELVILSQTYDSLTWLLPQCDRFPKAQRFVITQRL
ncbi:MAG: hypothetical protein ACREXS_16490 [Gammaproteobacteria bacterium]